MRDNMLSQMSKDSHKVIDTAVKLGLLDLKQAGLLREEVAMFPGQNLMNLLLKRQMINAEQLLELQKALASGTETPQPPPLPKQESSLPPEPPQPGFSWQAGPKSKVSGPPPPPQPARPGAPAADNLRAPSPVPLNRSPLSGPLKPPGPQPVSGLKSQLGTSASSSDQSGPHAASLSPPAAPVVGMTAPVTGALPKPEANWALRDFLSMARKQGCSDLHISPGRPPFVRLRGEIHYLDSPPLTAERSEQLNFSPLTPEQVQVVNQNLQLDYAFEIPSVGRHRCNVYRQRLGWEGAYRIINSNIPTMEELNLPEVLRTLTTYHQGLVLVTGPAGSGKTTTVAAMIDYINGTREDHIITVEDPIEYVIRPKKCQVTQREVGNHTGSFASALRAALRQDPDVIFVGELRDLETTAIAISAAETGHLVFGTLHTSSAARTVARILEVYPPSQRQQISTMVAESMRGVISQQLITRRDKPVPALAMEVLIFTSGVAQQIRDGRTHQLVSLMQSGKRVGMKTMDDSLMDLFQSGMISGQEAYNRAENKVPFEQHKGAK